MNEARKNLNRAFLLAAHRQHVKEGKYEAARLILRFLIRGRIKLGLDDAAYYLEHLLDGMGFRGSYDSRWYTVTYYI